MRQFFNLFSSIGSQIKKNGFKRKQNKKINTLSVFQLIFLLFFGLFLLFQIYKYKYLPERLGFSFLRFVPPMVRNFILIFVPLLFGAINSKKKVTLNACFRCWSLAFATLLVYYFCFFLKMPTKFKMWQVFGALFPIITSTSVLFSSIIFCFLCQPYIFDLQRKFNKKQNVLLLTAISLFGFALVAGTIKFDYSIKGLYLILYFAWGMFLANIKIKPRQTYLIILGGMCSFFIILLGVPGFDAIFWSQFVAEKYGYWNSQFLNNPSSPFMLFFAIAVFLIFKKIIISFSQEQIQFLIPAIVVMDAPISYTFVNSFHFIGSTVINKLVIVIGLFLVIIIWYKLSEHFLFNLQPFSNILQFLDKHNNLIDCLELTASSLKIWLKKNKFNLLPWVVLYVVSFVSFLIVSDHLRIQIGTDKNINAVVYLLGYNFFAIVLTTIFLVAFFIILYFVTTRYWTSLIFVCVLSIFWAIANKVKLNLRAEPIYLSDLCEIVNWKTLLSMLNPKLVVLTIIFLAAILMLDICLEIKIKVVKRKSWQKRSCTAFLCLLLLLTPLRFNHYNGFIYIVNHAFDNVPDFRNPEAAIQKNGPILNLLDYIDIQVMDKPDGYSKNKIIKLAKKYQTVATEINRNRKNDLSKQTVIFNLSESFVDPYTFPRLNIGRACPNPVKFIQSLKPHSTYGTMLSAGYGGGTADIEWETLTGFNLGLFKTSLTPYVQIVPKYNFYPTIAMNFSYKSTIHPFTGTYYSRIGNYHRFGFNKFSYLGSKYKIIKSKKIDKSIYNSDYTTYDNCLSQINKLRVGQFINLISIQNHMPYNDWYANNEYTNSIFGDFYKEKYIRSQLGTYIKGIQYTDRALEKFISQINSINKPITIVFYGDHYPAILSRKYISEYPVRLHSTRYFIFSNKYALQHGSKAKLTQQENKIVSSSDFIAMMLEQTNSRVTPYQALLTEIHKELPAITINYDGRMGFQLIDENGKKVKYANLNNKQHQLLKDYRLIQYDMNVGQAYGLKLSSFYK